MSPGAATGLARRHPTARFTCGLRRTSVLAALFNAILLLVGVGAIAAEAAKSKGISQIVFDRNGARYHGKVKALADAAREAGLKF